jgi:hypothetical protein
MAGKFSHTVWMNIIGQEQPLAISYILAKGEMIICS